MLAGKSFDADIPSSTTFSVNSPNRSGKNRKKSHCTKTVSSFCFYGGCLKDPATVFPLLACWYFDVVWSSVESCGSDVGDVLAIELKEPVDNPGTTIGAQFSVLHCICEGKVIVQGHEGPVRGVAQVVDCHGVTVGHEEKEEEEIEQEEESDGEKTLKERCACPWMG